MIIVRRNPQRSRYEIFDGEELVGIADYVLAEDVIVFPHTEIVISRRGQGFGSQLVKYALDDARASGYRVVAECWYVAQYIDEHPEYRDLARV